MSASNSHSSLSLSGAGSAAERSETASPLQHTPRDSPTMDNTNTSSRKRPGKGTRGLAANLGREGPLQASQSLSQSPAPGAGAAAGAELMANAKDGVGSQSLPGSRGRSPSGRSRSTMKQAQQGPGADASSTLSKSYPTLLSYDSEELRDLSSHPLSTVWPEVLDESFKNERGRFDPDLWHQATRVNRPLIKGGATRGGHKAAEERERVEAAGQQQDGKVRRSAKDRLKAEHNSDLVLGPQRRSFLGGCQGSGPPELDDLGEGNSDHSQGPYVRSAKEASNRNRRGGSGRIVTRGEREHPAGEKSGFVNFDQFASNYSRRREDWDSKNEADGRRDRKLDRGGGDPEGRGGSINMDQFHASVSRRREEGEDRRRDDPDAAFGRRREDWHLKGDRDRRMMDRDSDRFGGRRGFEDRDRGGGGPAGRLANRFDRGGRGETDYDHGGYHGRNRRNHQPEWMDEDVEQGGELMELGGFEDAEPERRERAQHSKKRRSPQQEEQKNEPSRKEEEVAQANDFNLDDFLHTDSIDKILAGDKNGFPVESLSANIAPDAEQGSAPRGSRFSQFFNSKPAAEGRPSENLAQQLGIDTGNPVFALADEKEKNPQFYFAPISPAATTTIGSPKKELSQQHGVDARSLEELERQLQGALINNPPAQKPGGGFGNNKQGADMGPFEKFAALVAPKDTPMGRVGPNDGRIPKGMPMPVADHDDPAVLQIGGPGPAQHPLFGRPPMPPHGHPQQRQQRAPPAPMPGPDLLQLIWEHPDQPHLLDHPDASVIKQGLMKGDLNPMMILNQFANVSGLRPAQKDIMVNFIKLFQRENQLPKRMNEEIYSIIHGPQMRGGPPRMPMHAHQYPPPDEAAFLANNRGKGGGGGPNLPLDPAIVNSRSRAPPPHVQLQQQCMHPGGPSFPPNFLPPRGQGPPTAPPSAGAPEEEVAQSTQQMLQNVLNQGKKREEEEQMQQQQQQRTPKQTASPKENKGSNSLSGGFTPTVVIKKLVADRRDSEPRVLPEAVGSSAEDGQQQAVQLNPLQSLLGGGGPSGSGQGGGELPAFGGDLSKFFAPGLLAQATAGNAPNMPPLPKQKALTLEELEHHQEKKETVKV